MNHVQRVLRAPRGGLRDCLLHCLSPWPRVLHVRHGCLYRKARRGLRDDLSQPVHDGRRALQVHRVPPLLQVPHAMHPRAMRLLTGVLRVLSPMRALRQRCGL